MTGVLAASVTVNGLNGVLVILAALLFLVATIAAFVVQPRPIWAICLAAGAFLVTLSLIVSG